VPQVRKHHADRVGLSGDETTRCQIGLIVQLFDFTENAPPRGWTDVSVIAENFGNGNYGHAELIGDILHSYLHAATLAMPAECRTLALERLQCITQESVSLLVQRNYLTFFDG
jgi:hypothetical protein